MQKDDEDEVEGAREVGANRLQVLARPNRAPYMIVVNVHNNFLYRA